MYFLFRGSHRGPFIPPRGSDDDVDKVMKELDEAGWLVDMIMRMVGLTGVKDTLVGNNRVRGVSGGEKKRAAGAPFKMIVSFSRGAGERGLCLETRFEARPKAR